MKKIILLTIIAILAGATLNCAPPVPQNAFRVSTRGKFHLFGIPLPFSVPNPNIAINLKTTTTPGAPGTTGAVTEFNPGGAYVSTGWSGRFDAVNAVLPAPWTVKVAPNQSTCTSAANQSVTFTAVAGTNYKLNCKWNIQITLLVEPGFVDLSTMQSPGHSLTGGTVKGSNDEALFKSAPSLKVKYYKQVDGEEYELDGEKSVISIAPDGTSLLIPIPDYYQNHGYVHYRILIVENEPTELFWGHGEFDVLYPIPEPTPTPCPTPAPDQPPMLCDPQS